MPDASECGGMTELRVHGVGGVPPAADAADQPAELSSGTRAAGFRRIPDHRASAADQAANRDADRQVEVYAAEGLSFSSWSRILCLALLPFLLANMAGWMCSARTRQSRWRFRLHRLAYGLGALALTVNATLVTVMIFADVLGYQTARIGPYDRWWSAPQRWPWIGFHPARQVLFGMLVPVLLVLVVLWATSMSFWYESVRPPYRAGPGRKEAKARLVTAAALPAGLADDEFWDGEPSGRLLTRVHAGVALGFLAIVIGVTSSALADAGTVHDVALGWIAIGGGAAAVALGAGYICLDALSTPGAAEPTDSSRAGSALVRMLRGWMKYVPVLALAALITSALFAWYQPAEWELPQTSASQLAGLPGMTAVIGWTALAIAVPVTAALVSMLLGWSRTAGPVLSGGPWVMLFLAFSLLNTVLLGAEIVAAHGTSAVTSDAAHAVEGAKIYLPYVLAAGVPLAVWAAMMAGVVFAVGEWLLRTPELPEDIRQAYREQAEIFSNQVPDPIRYWYDYGIGLPGPPDGTDPPLVSRWEQAVARIHLRGRRLLDAGWLLWAIIIGQLIMVWFSWQLHILPPVVIAVTGVGIASLVLPIKMRAFLSLWRVPAQRNIAIMWDAASFWPRSYHPFSPPCYAERAVPDLQWRMRMLHDIRRSLVLVAHGQGAMLATAALVQPGCRPADDRPALVTLGSTVSKLYSWAFPAYVTPDLLATLKPDGPSRVASWHNVYYPADPFAGPAAGQLASAGRPPVDHRLLDPAESWWSHVQDPPMPQGHAGYWKDPRVWELVNKVAAAART